MYDSVFVFDGQTVWRKRAKKIQFIYLSWKTKCLNDYNVIKLYQLSSYGQMYMAGKTRRKREINILIKIRIEKL